MVRGDNITLSTLKATVHLGAHADAPSHYGKGGQTIEQRSLDSYLGPCEVVPVTQSDNGLIRPGDVNLRFFHPRVLLVTGTFSFARQFREDFWALDPATVDYLHGKGVRLIGIDTPSVDPFHSKELPAHQRFMANDMAILEGVVLKDVPVDEYELIALPLKLVGFDASPVRAVLRTLD
jgi:arylformamidase